MLLQATIIQKRSADNVYHVSCVRACSRAIRKITAIALSGVILLSIPQTGHEEL